MSLGFDNFVTETLIDFNAQSLFINHDVDGIKSTVYYQVIINEYLIRHNISLKVHISHKQKSIQ